MRRLVLATIAMTAGCGGGGSSTPDAPANADVAEVSCTGATIAQTITTALDAYSPMTSTISKGGIVHFTPEASHDVTSDDTPPPFHVDFGGDKCFKFNVAKTYGFHCSFHGFTGTLTVQ